MNLGYRNPGYCTQAMCTHTSAKKAAAGHGEAEQCSAHKFSLQPSTGQAHPSGVSRSAMSPSCSVSVSQPRHIAAATVGLWTRRRLE